MAAREDRLFVAVIAGIVLVVAALILLGMWGLPNTIIEALAYHHTPALCPTQCFSALTTVHVANVWAHTLHPEHGPAEALDEAYLRALNLAQPLARWQEQCLPLGPEGK